MSQTFNPEKNARCRELVLEAVKARPGMTYPEIRDWVQQHKRFHLEQIGARCRELARDRTLYPNGFPIEIQYDEKGHVHVYLNGHKAHAKGLDAFMGGSK